MNRIKKIICQYREPISYLFFGVLTTAVNYITALAANAWFLQIGVEKSWPSVSIAWAISVLFAYVTNRIWVFRSKKSGKKEVLKELAAFVGARLSSGIIEVVLMTLFVDNMGYNFDIMKLLCNVLVIVLNYVFSKLFVFKKTKTQLAHDDEAKQNGG
ncbi:GtrA family protein [Scatolibacter rhodanostii]|uniref:GtrA family protein n=1 Tax=Scatolibacter rhodanostii TaxID=2014781 RepID=UPI001FA8FB6E|nr:GtrA family protein [Scatolibacter rhodanostii]